MKELHVLQRISNQFRRNFGSIWNDPLIDLELFPNLLVMPIAGGGVITVIVRPRNWKLRLWNDLELI